MEATLELEIELPPRKNNVVLHRIPFAAIGIRSCYATTVNGYRKGRYPGDGNSCGKRVIIGRAEITGTTSGIRGFC